MKAEKAASRPVERDFDRWRAEYATMTDARRREFDAWCFRYFPEQAHGSASAILESVEESNAASVVEVGGWRGDHAAFVLGKRPDLERWRNVEFCDEARAAPKCADPRYESLRPETFRWWVDEMAPGGDLCVLSHVAEHLSAKDLRGLLSAVRDVPFLHIETPLGESGSSWHGYLGTHILELGWPGLEALLAEEGWERARLADGIGLFRRRNA